MFLMFAAASLAMQGQIIATTREPRVPERQVQSVEGKCGERLLSISGFGLARPASFDAQISLDRSELAITPELQDFLSVPMATYRFAITCDQGDGAFLINAYRAHARPGSPVEYRLTAINVSTAMAVIAKPEERLEPEQFWFE
jgi:hypothetical protein